MSARVHSELWAILIDTAETAPFGTGGGDALSRLHEHPRSLAIRTAARLPHVIAEQLGDIQALAAACESKPAPANPDEADLVLHELLVRGAVVAQEIALLVAGGLSVGAWARARTLLELTTVAQVIDRGVCLEPKGANRERRDPKVAAAWLQQEAAWRRCELARRYRAQQQLKAATRVIAERHWIGNEGLGAFDQQVQLDEARQRGEVAAELLDRRPWADPSAPVQREGIRDTGVVDLLQLLEDPSEFQVRDTSSGRSIKQHIPDRFRWLVGNEAIHLGAMSELAGPWGTAAVLIPLFAGPCDDLITLSLIATGAGKPYFVLCDAFLEVKDAILDALDPRTTK